MRLLLGGTADAGTAGLAGANGGVAGVVGAGAGVVGAGGVAGAEERPQVKGFHQAACLAIALLRST